MLEAVNLSKRYDGVVALNNLDLTIVPGEIFCLLGANGAGKTTTINLFLGFTSPSAGKAVIGGVDVAADPIQARRKLAYIPEQVSLYPVLTGMENLRYFSALGGHAHYTTAQLEGFLTEAGLNTEAAGRRLSTYSKGMRQKVGIAIAIAKQAEALLLDEPTSGLDPQASNEFSQLLTRLSEKRLAILMATHDLFRAKETGHRVGIMKQGNLVATRSTKDIDHAALERLYLDSVATQ